MTRTHLWITWAILLGLVSLGMISTPTREHCTPVALLDLFTHESSLDTPTR